MTPNQTMEQDYEAKHIPAAGYDHQRKEAALSHANYAALQVSQQAFGPAPDT